MKKNRNLKVAIVMGSQSDYKTMKLTEAAGKIAEQAYKEQAAQQNQNQEQDNTESNASKDNVVDADFTEVKEDNKEDSKKAN